MDIVKFILLNPLSQLYLTYAKTNFSRSPKRIVSSFLEIVYIVSLVLPTSLILIPFAFIPAIKNENILDIPFCIGIILLLNKDFIDSRSAIKRIMGQQVICLKNGKPASELRCALRNITLFIWPIEVVFYVLNSNRRLGDYIFNTAIQTVTPLNIETLIIETKNKKWSLSALGALLISTILAIVTTILL